jgi:hypothetical protein
MQFMLVGAVRNDGRDGAFGEPAADARSAVSLVTEQVYRRTAFGQEALQQWLEEAALVSLAGRNQHFQRQPVAIG